MELLPHAATAQAGVEIGVFDKATQYAAAMITFEHQVLIIMFKEHDLAAPLRASGGGFIGLLIKEVVGKSRQSSLADQDVMVLMSVL